MMVREKGRTPVRPYRILFHCFDDIVGNIDATLGDRFFDQNSTQVLLFGYRSCRSIEALSVRAE